MNENEKGMKVYARVLRSSKVDGHPVGKEHHVYDSHLKEWERQNPDKIAGQSAEDKLEALKITPKAITTKSIKATKKSKDANRNKEAELLEKYKQSKKKRLANTLKFDDRVSHIKSAGNGL